MLPQSIRVACRASRVPPLARCVATALLVLAATSYAQSADEQKKIFANISEFATTICPEPDKSGKRDLQSLDGKAAAELGKLARKIGGINLEVAGKISSEEFKGLLQKDLLEATKNTFDCRQKVVASALDFIARPTRVIASPQPRASQGQPRPPAKPAPVQPATTPDRPGVKPPSAPAEIGRCREDSPLFEGKLSRDASVVLQEWQTPVVWKPGGAALLLPIVNEGGFDNHRKFQIDVVDNDPTKKTVPTAADLRLSGLDGGAQKVIAASLDRLKPGTSYRTRLGLVGVFPRAQDVDPTMPYLSVRYLSEWQRQIFSRSMVFDYYRAKDKSYCNEEAQWFADRAFEFPSVLFSEFIAISSDGYALYRIKRPNKDGSILADIQGKDIYITSSESSIQVDDDPARTELVFHKANALRAEIDLKKVVARGLLADIGLDESHIVRLVNFGVALQKDTLSSALLSVVHLDMKCEDVKLEARKSFKLVDCMSRPQGEAALAGRSERIFEEPLSSAWHPSSRLRIHYWLKGGF